MVMLKPILHVICVAYHRPIPLIILIDSFIVQSNHNWALHIVHDGEAPPQIHEIINSYHDPRVLFESTPQVNGNWGHPNREAKLKQLVLNHRDYVLITNDDNYYVPDFVKYMLRETKEGKNGLVYCNTVYSYYQYKVLVSELRENMIDMGSFIVKLDVAKKVGFNYEHLSADGRYAVECADYCRLRKLGIIHLPKPLFVHN